MDRKKTKVNKNFTKLTQKRGISLIVSVVTIIVIIILAAVVILTVSKNNPVESAREATFKEDLRSFRDDLALSISKDYTAKAGQRDNKFNADKYTTEGESDSVYTYIPSFTKKYEGKFAIVNDELKYVGEEEKEIAWSKDLGVKTKVPVEWLATIADITEDGVPIPKGFTYVTGTKETGTVIEDVIGNQFVWIPATEASYVKDLNFKSYGSEISNSISDDVLPNGIIDEVADVKKYGGFYIGRYEAGIPDGDTATSNKIGIPVSKQGAIVWTDITYDNAKASAESMISNSFVQTGILTGKAWDTTCHYIEDAVPSITDSRTYGNYSNSKAPANISGYGKKQVAGFSDKWSAKNIYDIAGNVMELTSEISASYHIGRGGSCHVYGGILNFPVSYRSERRAFNEINDLMGFRIRLYIK